MYFSGHLRVLILIAASVWLGTIQVPARNPDTLSTRPSISQPQENTQRNEKTTVHLRWANRPGIFRYRVQLAGDHAFHDIIFDRVVTGNEIEITDLEPGAYFWRIAPLTRNLGDFSSAAPIEVRALADTQKTEAETPRTRPEKTAADSTQPKQPASNSVVATGGWRTAVGEITYPVLAHLRSPNQFGLVGINGAGVVFGLDAASGVALWSTGRRLSTVTAARSGRAQTAPLLVKARSGLDNIVVLSGVNVAMIEGTSGRELWRVRLPAVAHCGAALNDKGAAGEIFLVDNSLEKLIILDAKNGNTIAQIKLPHRLVGRPVFIDDAGPGRMLFAYDSGHVEVRGRGGALVRSGDAGSPVTTPPLFVAGPGGGLILVGTRSGLTALGADDLRALGRVAINGDAPRGNLAKADLNGDGSDEVIMATNHGRIVAVNAADGKTVWDAAGGSESETVAFADINADGVLDVLMAGGQTFAVALSGRDGSIVWRDDESPVSVANHATASRSVFAIPSAAGVLLIGNDASRTGLRAIEFPKANTKADRH